MYHDDRLWYQKSNVPLLTFCSLVDTFFHLLFTSLKLYPNFLKHHIDLFDKVNFIKFLQTTKMACKITLLADLTINYKW